MTYKHHIDENEVIVEVEWKEDFDDSNIIVGIALFIIFAAIFFIISIIVFPPLLEGGDARVYWQLITPTAITCFVPAGVVLANGFYRRRHPKPPQFFLETLVFDKRQNILRVKKGPLVGESREFDHQKLKVKEYPFEKIIMVRMQTWGTKYQLLVDFTWATYQIYEGEDAREALALEQEIRRLQAR